MPISYTVSQVGKDPFFLFFFAFDVMVLVPLPFLAVFLLSERLFLLLSLFLQTYREGVAEKNKIE